MGVITTPILLTANMVSNQSSQNTASITPQVGRLIIVDVFSKGPNATAGNLPSLSGLGVTWHQVSALQSSFDSGEWRLTRFAGIVTSPQTGAITISFSGQSQQSIGWAVTQFPGNVINNVANPQNAAQQSNTAQSPRNTGITSLTVTLSTFANVNNGTLGVFANDGQASFTGITNFTVLTNLGTSAGNFILGWSPANQTSITATYSGTNFTGNLGLASEINCQIMGGAVFL